MKWIVKNDNGVLEFKSIQVCTESQFNKIMADINHQRILTWCDDNHVLAEVQRGEQCMSILREVITEVTESEARRMDRLHLDFLKFVDELPEIDAYQEDAKKVTQKEQSQAEIIEFVTNTLIGLHENDVTGAILITSIGPISIPCGKISHKMLTQMFETWLEKYGK